MQCEKATQWGGLREGAGRKKTVKKAERRRTLKISEDLYQRWTELKNLRIARTEEVFSYLLDIAREVD